MKSVLFIVFSMILTHLTYAQGKDKINTYDDDWKPTGEKRSTYLVRTRQTDSGVQVATYNTFGPRIKQEILKDESGKIKNGTCSYYHSNGYIESYGRFADDKPEGRWWYYNNHGNLLRIKEYANGVVTKDSAVAFTPRNTMNTDTMPEESQFRGGTKSWMQFMNENFRYPQRALKNKIEGMVELFFMVDEQGQPRNAEITRSAEFSLDEEALRLMTVCPAWVPAKKEGVVVRSYKVQPIGFRFQ